MEGALKVCFSQFDDGTIINTGSITVTCVNVKCLEEKAEEIDESIMLQFHSRAFEFTHIFYF